MTVTGAASTGFTVTYGGASAGIDVPNIELVNLSCGGCFGSVEETNHGGANDSFTLNYNGNVSAPIVNGVELHRGRDPGGADADPPRRRDRDGRRLRRRRRGSTTPASRSRSAGTLAATNVPVTLGLQDFTAGASGFVGETDKGGAVDNKGGTVTPTGNTSRPSRRRQSYTIPLRTPFALTGSATDADGDALLYSWEQNDRGGTAGTSLLNNTKTNGPLFAMFPISGQISEDGHAQVQLAGREPPDRQSDAGLPGPAADPRQQHERRHGRVPDGADRPAGADPGQGVLRRVPPDVGLRRVHGCQREPALAALPLHGA